VSSWQFNMTPLDVPKVNTKYRRIQTKIPVPESLELFQRLQRVESRSMHGQMPVVWDRAEGFQIYDPYGNCWIDFTSTIFVTNTGHANPSVIAAIQKQLNQKLLHSYTFAHQIRIEFLEYLIKMLPSYFQKAFLLSSGTEATECALKLMRMHGQRIRKSKLGIISFSGAMHGRTLGAEMMRGMPEQSSWIGYRDPHMYHLSFPYPWSQRQPSKENYDWAKHFEEDMAQLKSQGVNFDDIAGIMVESYVGWGAIFYPTDYIQVLCRFAQKHNVLVAFDDIQGGFGRTGKLLAYQHYAVEPDLVCLGKGLSGCLPLSAVVGKEEIMDLPQVGSMSSTHSANPLCCAVGLANLKAMDELNLVQESERKGKILQEFLNQLKEQYPEHISYVFGKGLVAAILFKDPRTNKPDASFPSQVCELCMQKGLLLVHTGRESIKIGPPLIITDEAFKEGLGVLAESIAEMVEKVEKKERMGIAL